MSSKTHIQRVERSTNHGAIVRSLCGLSNNRMVDPKRGDVTCRRCAKIYSDNGSLPPTLEERLREVGQQVMDNLMSTKEVRTTSSTGGQKGVKEARYSLIPARPLEELAILFGRGARKYAEHQWRQGYEWSKSQDAISRHFGAFNMGFDYDVCSNDPDGCRHTDADGNPFEAPAPDTCYNHTGAHHLTAVAWHSFVLLEFKDTHPDHDDRYIPERNVV